MSTDETKMGPATDNQGFKGLGKVLVIETGGHTYRIQKDRVVIGSVISADVRLIGKGVSPLHAVLEVSAQGQMTLYDLASETGVIVNGQKAVTHELKSGDQVQIGTEKLSISSLEVGNVSSKIPSRESGGRKLFLTEGEDLSPLLLESSQDVEEIYDYRPSQKQALEVVFSWRGTILDIEHFVSQKQVVLGTQSTSDFAIPPVLASLPFVLATRQGESFEVQIDPAMKGVVQQNRSIKTFEALRAEKGSNSFRIQIGMQDFVKLTVGEIDFYLSYTAAPPRLKHKRLFDRDPFFWKVLIASALLSFALILALMQVKIPEQLETIELPPRVASILFQPELYTSKLKPIVDRSKVEKAQAPQAKPQQNVTKIDLQPSANPKREVPKFMNVGKTPEKVAPGAKIADKSQSKGSLQSQKQSKEGEGAKAKGEAGKRGSKTADSGAEAQKAAKRPSPQGGTGKGGSNSQVAGEGNLDFIKGAGQKIENLLAGSTQKLGKTGKALQGFGGFDTQGEGGKALSGSGSGGGGNASSLGGLGNKGIGGGRIGTGLGASGSGDSIAGGSSRVVLKTGGPEETVVMGSIDADAIEAALLAHRDEFRLCYEKEINAGQPKLSGRVLPNFVIGPSGRVTQASIQSTTLNNTNAEQCIVRVIRRIQFPIPLGGGIVQVTYPFKFRPTN